MLAVPDIGLLVSGSLWHGRSRRVLDAAREGRLVLVTAESMLTELGDVMERTKHRARVNLTGESVSELVQRVREIVLIADQGWPAVRAARDPDDDDILGLAAAVHADVIISSDKDLLVLRRFDGIPILAPVDVCRALGI